MKQSKRTMDNKEDKNTHCNYEHCDLPVFATENLTGMNGKLCQKHFRKVFGRLIDTATIVDLV